MISGYTATHILVADGGRARLLHVSGPLRRRELTELETFENPSAHLPVHEMLSDRAGRTFESSGRGGVNASHMRHGVGGDYDPHVAEIKHYVDRMAERLIGLHRNNQLGHLVLIAEPRLLGVMRAILPTELSQLIVREVSGDYVHADHEQLLGLIDAPT